MGVSFYLQDSRFWDSPWHRENLHLGMPLRVFEILNDLLELESPDDDYTGTIGADDLLRKIAKARGELHRQGKEWERSPEPPPEGQEDQSLKILGTPGIDQGVLHSCLDTLEAIALYAREVGTGVQWS